MRRYLRRRFSTGFIALGLTLVGLGVVTPQLGHNAARAAEGSCSEATISGDGWDRWHYITTYTRDNGDGTRSRIIVSGHYDYFGNRYLHDDYTVCG